MELISIILGALAALFAGLNIFQMFSFRAYKQKYKMEAEKDTAMAAESKQTALEHRLSAIENLYAEQGKVIDNLRKELLSISKEKFESDRRIVILEEENKTLNEKITSLSKRMEAYKTIAKGE